jgi:hypothetical protein
VLHKILSRPQSCVEEEGQAVIPRDSLAPIFTGALGLTSPELGASSNLELIQSKNIRLHDLPEICWSDVELSSNHTKYTTSPTQPCTSTSSASPKLMQQYLQQEIDPMEFFQGYPSHELTLSSDDARMVSIETRVQIRAIPLIHGLQSDSNGTQSNPTLG